MGEEEYLEWCREQDEQFYNSEEENVGNTRED